MRAVVFGALAPLAALAIVALTLPLSASGKVLIVQTNSAGDNVHIIDAATNKIVGEITGIERGSRRSGFARSASGSTSATKPTRRWTSWT